MCTLSSLKLNLLFFFFANKKHVFANERVQSEEINMVIAMNYNLRSVTSCTRVC